MPVEKGDIFAKRDVFVDYPFEEVMYRWDHKEKKSYRKFYGEAELPEPVPHDNGMYNEALLSGDEISETAYREGKPKEIAGRTINPNAQAKN